jgi:hypothetical protein
MTGSGFQFGEVFPREGLPQPASERPSAACEPTEAGTPIFVSVNEEGNTDDR